MIQQWSLCTYLPYAIVYTEPIVNFLQYELYLHIRTTATERYYLGTLRTVIRTVEIVESEDNMRQINQLSNLFLSVTHI